jgi:O-antigen/teichoic acid export membrane protein
MSSAKDILYLLIGIYTVNSLHSWLYVVRNVKLSFRLNTRWLKKLIAFSKYSTVNNIGSNLYNQTNPVMIGLLINETAVALYGAAMIFVHGFYMLGEAFNMIVFPLTSYESTRSDFVIDYKIGRMIYEKYLKYMIIIFFPISGILFLFPKPLLDVIYAGKYSTIECVLILRIVGFWGLFAPFVRLMGSIINGLNRPDILALAVILTTVSSILFNIILIRMWGIVGSAVSLVLSLAVMFGVLHVLSNKLLEIRYLEPFRQMKRTAISHLTPETNNKN